MHMSEAVTMDLDPQRGPCCGPGRGTPLSLLAPPCTSRAGATPRRRHCRTQAEVEEAGACLAPCEAAARPQQVLPGHRPSPCAYAVTHVRASHGRPTVTGFGRMHLPPSRTSVSTSVITRQLALQTGAYSWAVWPLGTARRGAAPHLPPHPQPGRWACAAYLPYARGAHGMRGGGGGGDAWQHVQ